MHTHHAHPPRPLYTGEWKTQYSRQQLRALRQKRQQEADKTGSSSDSEPIKSEKNAATSEEQVDETKPSAPVATEKASNGKSGRRAKGKKQRGEGQRATEKSSEPDNTGASKDSTQSAGMLGMCVMQYWSLNHNCCDLIISMLVCTFYLCVDEEVAAAPSSSTTSEPPSADQRLPTPPLESVDQGLTEVEKALQEAGETIALKHTPRNS